MSALAGNPEEKRTLREARSVCAQLRASGVASQPPPLQQGEGRWVHGPSPVSGGRRQFERQIEILSSVPLPPPALGLHFHVRSLRSATGHWFDLENIAYVVIACWRHDHARPGPVKVDDYYRPQSIWATTQLMDKRGEGLQISHEAPPSLDESAVQVDVVIGKPPRQSTAGANLPELEGRSELSNRPWLGLELTFGAEVDIGEFGFYGPVDTRG